MLRKTTEQLSERTEAMKKELATQKQEFSQRLFEVEQENDQVSCSQNQARARATGQATGGVLDDETPLCYCQFLWRFCIRAACHGDVVTHRSGAWRMRRGQGARMPRQLW